MNPNPKLMDRINERHIGKGLAGRECQYYPHLMSAKLHDELKEGQRVIVTDGVLKGKRPGKGRVDTRMVEVIHPSIRDKRFVVFLRDLSPVISARRGY